MRKHRVAPSARTPAPTLDSAASPRVPYGSDARNGGRARVLDGGFDVPDEIRGADVCPVGAGRCHRFLHRWRSGRGGCRRGQEDKRTKSARGKSEQQMAHSRVSGGSQEQGRRCGRGVSGREMVEAGGSVSREWVDAWVGNPYMAELGGRNRRRACAQCSRSPVRAREGDRDVRRRLVQICTPGSQLRDLATESKGTPVIQDDELTSAVVHPRDLPPPPLASCDSARPSSPTVA